MAARKSNKREEKREEKREDKREREALAEPMEGEQASIQQTPAEMARAHVWELHLRGLPKVRIAALVNLDRGTVAKLIAACYADISDERKQDTARKLDGAIQRMRRIQEQAWDDHDSDDERERQVLSLTFAQAQAPDSDAEPSRKGRESSVSVKYQSQRAQYLRIILDAEKEIARLEGLYEGLLDGDAAVSVTFIKLTDADIQRGRLAGQSGLLASSARLAAIPAPRVDQSDGGVSDGGESDG